MSKLKIIETKVCKEYVNTYFPDRNYALKTVYHLIWANTSKGWFYFNTKYINPDHAARLQLKMHSKGKINTTHWSTFL